MKTLLTILILASAALAQNYQPSKKIVIGGNGFIAGDPQIVRTDKQYLMFVFRTGMVNGRFEAYSTFLTSNNITGPWANETKIIDDFHKFRILVDGHGTPVKLAGTYHGYAVSYTPNKFDKEIFHFVATSLTGPWLNRGKVVAKGSINDFDGLYTDAPGALYFQHKIYITYMAHPATPRPDFGYGMRLMLSVATDPNGEYKKMGVILNPSKNGWDKGYIGGSQIVIENGKFVMYYNASNIRPERAGWETPSLFGKATANNPAGPWHRSSKALAHFIAGSVEKENIWRPYVVQHNNRTIVFYNTGVTGHESITYATL